MPDDCRCERLAAALQPLLDKFYRTWRSPMRAPAGSQGWVARRHGRIVAALCLTPLAHGHWLTGVLAEPAQRRQGVASGLLRHALAQSEGPVWLFCHPKLATFYARLGFASSERLPAELAERLARYRRHKPLLAMESRGAY